MWWFLQARPSPVGVREMFPPFIGNQAMDYKNIKRHERGAATEEGRTTLKSFSEFLGLGKVFISVRISL